jgi:uncharacterized membrane protein (DUF2068 family)
MVKLNRPIGITVLSIFFMVATVITLVASFSLFFPGGVIEPMWQLNPRGHAGLAAIGVWAGLLLFVVAFACAVAAIGLWRGSLWGYVTAVVLLAINLLGDVINVVLGIEPRAALGIPIVIAILVYLLSPRTRRFFGRSTNA